MMKQFLLPALSVAVLAGSVKAEDPSTATAWTCTSQMFGRAKYVINGNELKKRDDHLERYEACRREHPAPTLGPDGKISAEALPTDPCEPLDLESYTFKIELNNPDALIAVSPAAGSDNAFTWVAKRMIILDKLTGKYDETLLSTPTLPHSPEAKKQSTARIVGKEYEGTCDVKSLGDTNWVARVPIVSQDLVPVVEEEKKPRKKTETGETHLHAQRHHRHGHSHKH